MSTKTLRNMLPHGIKHPLLAINHWYWQLRGLPAQSRGDLAIFKDILLRVEAFDLRVFEWGSGASTVYYSQFLRAFGREFKWYAGDNSKDWCERCQQDVDKNSLTEQVHLFCSEFPAFWQVSGYSYAKPVPPQEYLDDPIVKQYVENPKTIGGQFDIMIIDGRFRRRCLQTAAEVISPSGIVILHDAQRAHYHPSLELYPHVKFLETGMLPGTNQTSTIALASVGTGDLISELAEKYRGLASSRNGH